MQPKQLTIIAGPNGAGKTTFAMKYLPTVGCSHFINADLIAQGIEPLSAESAALRAGRLFLDNIASMAKEGRGFAFESTLVGKSYLPMLKSLKAQGYQITIYFLWLPSVDLALHRISLRVKRGGHSIPEKTVRRRYFRGLFNFLHIYAPLAEHAFLTDNTGLQPLVIGEYKSGAWKKTKADLFDEILKLAEGANEK